MALPVLARIADLAQRTGRPLGDQRMVAALVTASSRFRGAVHHDVSLVTDEVIELDGSGSRVILLPAVPVVSVARLELSDSGAVLVERRDFSVGKKTGILRRLPQGRSWPDVLGYAQLTYTHGYDATPDTQTGELSGLPADIQSAVLDMAEILLTVEAGVQSKTVLGDTVAYGSAGTTGVTQAWSDAVLNYEIANGDRA